MKYKEIIEKAKKYSELCRTADSLALQNWEAAFEVEYTHESTAIEGNTLTLEEIRLITQLKYTDFTAVESGELKPVDPNEPKLQPSFKERIAKIMSEEENVKSKRE